MIFAFILGALAGFATPYAEPHVQRVLGQVVPETFEVSEAEADLLTLVVLLLGAAILTGGGSSVALLVGALVGVFGKRIVGLVQDGRGA